ncbi:MAG: hypothetical protein QM497_09085 [Sulfurimonas sp.]
MQNKMPEIALHDIKPLVEIHEYSIYYFGALVLLGVLVLAGIVYLIVKYFQAKNAFNIRKEHLKLLKQVDFSDPKRSAYDITFYGATFKDDTSRHLEMYEEMLDKLQEYKYKKDVNSLDTDVKEYVDLYRGMIDV